MIAARFGDKKLELAQAPKEVKPLSFPALQVDEKTLLTSSVAICHYLAPALCG
jgi:hypothetical protein